MIIQVKREGDQHPIGVVVEALNGVESVACSASRTANKSNGAHTAIQQLTHPVGVKRVRRHQRIWQRRSRNQFYEDGALPFFQRSNRLELAVFHILWE